MSDVNGAKKMWEKLAQVNVNEEDEILEPFEHFEKGTSKFDIWLWIENTYDVCVGKVFLGGNKNG